MSVTERETAPNRIPPGEADLFRQAATILEEKGWCQDVLAEDEDGEELEDPCDDHAHRFCLYGAIHRALGVSASSTLHKTLGFESAHAAVDWNDRPGRTQAEVVERLRRAAEGEFLA